jgi:hypothetical protein
LREADIEVLEELDLSPYADEQGQYRVLVGVDPEFMRLAFAAHARAAALALLKVAVYEEEDLTRVDASEFEKGPA